MSAPADNDCARCGLALHNYSEATDCRMCDPLCPVFGTHGELWDGDEETSRAAYLAGQVTAAPPPLVASMSLTAEDLVRRAVSGAGHGEHVERPRWSWVGAIFSVGSTSASQLCRRFGFDPDEPRGRDDSEDGHE